MSFVEEGQTDFIPVAWNDYRTDPPRSLISRLSFALPTLCCGVSYLLGGFTAVTGVGMSLLTLLCVIFLFDELRKFPSRQGLGGILLYGGMLTWYCHDYVYNWLAGIPPEFSAIVTPYTLAKDAFYTCLFVFIAASTLELVWFRTAEKLITIVPEPADSSLYLIVIGIALAIGLSPFFLLVNEPAYSALWKVITLDSEDVKWSVGRTVLGTAANLNYNWGGYVVVLLQIGCVSGILCALYALFVTRSVPAKILCAAVWLFWTLDGFTSYRRGDMAFMVLPLVGFLYFKYQQQAIRYFRKSGWKAYALAGVVGGALFLVVQYQTAVRYGSDLELLRPRGNTMFSEAIRTWAYIPERNNGRYYYDNFPGEDLVRPLPDCLFWLILDPIPRALWNSKPLDSFYGWHNVFETNEPNGFTGTGISSGIVGFFYFRFGPFGVMEGATLFGWMLGLSERALRRAANRPLALLFVMAYATFIFRDFRDMDWHTFDPVFESGVALYVIVKLTGAAPKESPQYMISQPSEVMAFE